MVTAKQSVEEINNAIPAEVDEKDERAVLFSRRDEWGVTARWTRAEPSNDVDADEDEDDVEWQLHISLPGGTTPTTRWVGASRARAILATPPIHIKSIEGLNAIRIGDDTVEVALRSASSPLLGLRRLPWATRTSPRTATLDDGEMMREEIGRDEAWVLPIQDMPSGMYASIGSTSPHFAAFTLGRPASIPTLTLKGIDVTRHDATKRQLKSFAGALAFDFDLKYGLGFTLQTTDALLGGARLVRRNSREDPPTSPRLEYLDEPLSLYWYGRSANNMPLLRYLSFYQVLEFHFPQFFRCELIDRLRTELKNPLFKLGRDADLTRLISVVEGGSGRRPSESEQLEATLRACVTENALFEFLEQDGRIKQNLTGKKILEGVSQLNLSDRSNDLRSQVAKRVYAIRCRIVHTKDDDVTYGSKMLLPFSEEAKLLRFDVALVQFLAQQVLIASSRERSY